MISERLWRARFGADPRVVGTTILLNDAARVIVGVMPRTFEFPNRLGEYWIPLQLRPDNYIYGNPYIEGVARLKPGVSSTQAQAELQGIAREAARVDPSVNAQIGVSVISLRDEISPHSRLLLWWLVAAAAGLLLIACTNLANLLLTRGLARQKELAVRAALGAGRQRLVRQMFTEHLWLAAAGGVAGVAVALAALPTIARLVPTTLPIAEAPALDLRLLASALALTLACAVGFGLIPALRTARQAGCERAAGRRAGLLEPPDRAPAIDSGGRTSRRVDRAACVERTAAESDARGAARGSWLRDRRGADAEDGAPLAEIRQRGGPPYVLRPGARRNTGAPRRVTGVGT